MIKSKRKYINPKALADLITACSDPSMMLGDEKDVGEFNINFLARIDETLGKELRGSVLSSQYLNPSTRNRAFLRLSRENFIARAFFGKLLILTREVNPASESPIEFKEETLFSQVMISPMAENIYQGWEANYFSEISEFVGYNGVKTKAEQECWILQEQKVLFLLIQRVTYDKQEQKPKKITTPIQFDEVIYIDRFMECNRKISLKIRKQVEKLKEELVEKQKLLETYLQFGKEKQSLLATLNATLEFLQHQSSAHKKSPLYFETKASSKVSNAADAIKEYASCVSKKIASLEEEIEDVRKRIRTAYDGMKAVPYELHSIWAHSGVPESGHYYAYIYDKTHKKWRKYNDRQVTDEDRDNIFPPPQNTKPAPILSSAYCLIYTKKEDSVHSKPGTQSMMLCKELSVDSYYELIPEALGRLVNEDNRRLEREIIECKNRKATGNICKEYNHAISILQSSMRKLGVEAINFVFYLYTVRNLVYRWLLLDQTVKNVQGEKAGLDLLLKNAKAVAELNEEIKNTRAPFYVAALAGSDAASLSSAKAKFKEVVLDWITQRYVLEGIVRKDWMKALNGITFYLVQAKHTSSKNGETMNDILKVLLLRLFSYVNESLIAKNIPEAIKYVDLVSAVCVSYISRKDPHKKFMYMLFTSVFGNVSQLFTKNEYKTVQGYIERINDDMLLLESPIAAIIPKEVEEEWTAAVKDGNKKVWGWDKSAIGEDRINAMDRLMTEFLHQNFIWVTWHRKVAANEQVTIDEVYEDERNVNIDYLKVAQ
eukprot:TRINITY_DN7755_c0_g1_i15.p1 TRINITY_DN7755_c0_g1~~TRINITY_DN7755_c0_g1_i15.p1  ORF type:complete len:771 (+),score=212.17 TRINITY_DN7755_c0_g1_i15:500-2812(+)